MVSPEKTFVAKGGLVGAVVCTPKLWDIAAGIVIAGSVKDLSLFVILLKGRVTA